MFPLLQSLRACSQGIAKKWRPTLTVFRFGEGLMKGTILIPALELSPPREPYSNNWSSSLPLTFRERVFPVRELSYASRFVGARRYKSSCLIVTIHRKEQFFSALEDCYALPATVRGGGLEGESSKPSRLNPKCSKVSSRVLEGRAIGRATRIE